MHISTNTGPLLPTVFLFIVISTMPCYTWPEGTFKTVSIQKTLQIGTQKTIQGKKFETYNILVRRKGKQTYKWILLWPVKQISEVYLQWKGTHIES